MAKHPAPCSRSAEEVDFGDGPNTRRRYVMVCARCGFEAWQHRRSGAQVVIGDFVPVDVCEREREAA